MKIVRVSAFTCPICDSISLDKGEAQLCLSRCRQALEKADRDRRNKEELARKQSYLVDRVDDIRKLQPLLISGMRAIYDIDISFNEFDISVVIDSRNKDSVNGWRIEIRVNGQVENLSKYPTWTYLPASERLFLDKHSSTGIGFKGFARGATYISYDNRKHPDGPCFFNGRLALHLEDWPLLKSKWQEFIQYEAVMKEDVDRIKKLTIAHGVEMVSTIGEDPEVVILREKRDILEQKMNELDVRYSRKLSELRASYPRIEFPEEPDVSGIEEVKRCIFGDY